MMTEVAVMICTSGACALSRRGCAPRSEGWPLYASGRGSKVSRRELACSAKLFIRCHWTASMIAGALATSTPGSSWTPYYRGSDHVQRATPWPWSCRARARGARSALYHRFDYQAIPGVVSTWRALLGSPAAVLLATSAWFTVGVVKGRHSISSHTHDGLVWIDTTAISSLRSWVRFLGRPPN
ncbi:hypothetical protein VOLCADRAFT_105851 [Volvox carteri f. nagariensis]|uniref:Uncharacterized protein n=1 Tax=Volvox carteri f. nagariensis TaxID=3068 RepID=D8U3L3_VOLCA|nr:uncharacterized protein VOLCADRAFT_105851 [Volvox carteri f. nagariensis]EFJ45629.1 hypothetical protein VOLCADRAFT_105851 [Volvox carteri f. nagariensis]|eukprot:XP_002953319.1 hypothetical protein VOLCADRAFT_105851 [Volvox carteri f. nagariensis]